MTSPLHVLWTPSWYPSPGQPLNGSFFREQVGFLRDAGMTVGVASMQAHPFSMPPTPMYVDDVEQTITRSVPFLPARLRADGLTMRIFAESIRRTYEQRFGVPDVIHAHSVFPGILFARYLHCRWGVPYVLTEHRPSSLRQPPSSRRDAIERAVRQASARLTVSDDMADKLTSFYQSDPFQVSVLPVDDAFFEIEPDRRADDPFTFIHVSMLGRNKRVEEVIDAFAQVNAYDPHTRLTIVGGNEPDVANLRTYARSVSEAVQVLGSRPRSEIPRLMAAADCHVLVSASEAGGTVFSEAQAAGTPSIGSATPAGRTQIVPGTGIVVGIDQPGELRDAMRKIIADTRAGGYRRESIRAIARARVSKEKFASDMLTTYIDSLRGTPRTAPDEAL